MQGGEEIADDPPAEGRPEAHHDDAPDEMEGPPIPLHLYRDWRPAGREAGGLPAERLLGLVGELPAGWEGAPAILAITSGKGGVGKSNIAASLALLLAAAGTRAALIDADLGLGNLDVLVGTQPGNALGDVLAGRKGLRDVLTPLPGGVDFGGGGVGLAAGRRLDPIRRLKLLDELAGLRKHYDLVVLDCSSGVGGEVLDFCGLADRVMVVTTPEPTALTGAYGLLKALHGKGGIAKASIVVNVAEDHPEAHAAYARLASVTRQFLGADVPDGGYIVADPMVARAVRKRRIFVQAYPRCQASRCLAGVAARVLPSSPASGARRRAGLLERILGYLE